jgi:2-polyprenyl-3-methyl-5-hydroxy-6-metoxy-1,4-benzoquinol methylase/uncharacterized protein YbaR (Trm112 family)
MIDPWLLKNLVCPIDHSPLRIDGDSLTSAGGRRYPVVEGVPVMLVESPDQTLWVAEASLSHTDDKRDELADPLALNTVGVDPDQRDGIRRAFAQGNNKVDPVVSYIISHTCGIAYKHLVGHLQHYPIPELRLPPGDGKRLLDIGCNWGRWSVAAARNGYEPVGIDPSLGAVLAARRVAAQLGVNCRHVVGDARFLPFRENVFDTVFSYSVLQHFPKDDVRTTLSSVNRILAPGGTCMVQMPNFLGIRCLQHQFRRRFREATGFQVRYWSLSELTGAFEAAIGPSKPSVDCFFGLGLQSADKPLMPSHLRIITGISDLLRTLSQHFPPLIHVADSVYIESTKR